MIKQLFRQMLVTQIVSSMTVTLCMLIDSIMIGRFLGLDAVAAYGFAAPVLLVFAALGGMISAGVQVMCGKTMGSGDKKGTNACYSISVTLAAAISLVGVTAVLLFTDPICVILGAGENTPDNEVFRLTRDYLRGFIVGAPAFIAAQIMVPYMQMSGSRTRLVTAVIAMTLGDVLFDILNVFVFRRGTWGMGMASSLSYYIAFIIGVVYFFKKDCPFKFRPKLVKVSVCWRLILDGVPTLINQISLVLLTLTLNKLLLSVGGNLAVAAYSVISTAGNICYAFSTGGASVALTLASIFFVDEDRSSLKKLVSVMASNAAVICGTVTLAVLLGAPWLVKLFIVDRSATGIAVTGVRLFVLSLVPCALNTSFKNYYQGIDKVKLTMFISFMQNFLLTALSAFVLSRFWGLNGVWLGFLFGETATLIMISAVVFIRYGKVSVSAEAYSMLPEKFGVSDDRCFEVVTSAPADVVVIAQKASDFCLSKGLTNRVSSLISLCIEEMANNIVSHGFKDGKEHTIDVRVMILENAVSLRIRDNCKKFDPVKYTELHSEEDPAAHIGVRMVMKMVRSANYVNSLGLNNLTLIM